ncbi:hypothetical protein JOB18_038642 [Solea senegalensis]|uniref:Uncharacterized protein n=1 Tax=Solea senegalensis TaxID=28829 RepID=A0AAV6S4S2_SOLSE|nr:hypothetical protein JOB18_038642 [Solea senegalensis]
MMMRMMCRVKLKLKLSKLKLSKVKMDQQKLQKLQEHERDQTVDISAGNGKEVDANNGNVAAVGKDEEEEDQIRPQDSISNVQSRHHGSSSTPSTSSASRKAEAEQAVFLARAADLSSRSQQHASLPPQSNASPLVTPTIMPKLVKKQVAVSMSLSTNFASQSKPTISQGSQPPQLQSKTTFSQSFQPFQPTLGQEVFQPLQGQNQTAGLYNLLQQQNDIMALLVQMQTSQLLPHREIPTYDGDPLQFNTFMKASEHCLEAKTSCKGDCCTILNNSLGGNQGILYLHMTADKGCAVAKKLLKEHFGNEFKITAA